MIVYRREETIPDEVWDLYASTFHGIEQIPKEGLLRTMGQGAALYTYHEGGLIGFTFQFTMEVIVLLVYFATEPERRNRGHGARILDLFREINAGKRSFLVLETCDGQASDNAMRIRRRNFYLRNGCSDGIRIFWDDWFDTLNIQGSVSDAEIGSVIHAFEGIYSG